MKLEGLSANINWAKSETSIAKMSKLQLEPQEQLDKRVKLSEGKEEKNYLTKEDLEHLVNGINEFLHPQFTSLSFNLHDDTGSYYVEVIDQETNNVIREIPAKEILDMRAKMLEYLGVFVDEKL